MLIKDATILIVDDEPMLVEIMEEWFVPVAARVLTASDGMLALKIMESNRVDVLLTDVRMPNMDGFSLVKNMNASSARTPSVIFVSAFSDLSLRDAMDLGAETTISKPASRQDILAKVSTVLMEKSERWARPFTERTQTALDQSFPSLDHALAAGDLAFGLGGFCLRSTERLPSDAVNLALEFVANGQSIVGKGIVRWQEHRERRMGAEIMYLEDNCRDWVVDMTSHLRTKAFIPRDTNSSTNLPMIPA